MAFLDFLTDLFGGKSSQAPSTGGGEYSWIGPLISAVGNVASRARWTPREDATASDIREANRNNLIAQLLGAGAQAYGGYQKQQAYGDLADIFKSGGMTTTTGTLPVPQGAVGAPSSVSERLFEWGQKNPEFGDVALQLGLKQMGAEQDRAAKLEAARIKANQPPSFQEMAAADNILKALIPDPEERRAEVERQFWLRGKPTEPLGPIGATAQPTPPILGMDFTQKAQPATPSYDVEALREAGKRWQGGEEGIDITLPKGTNIDEATQVFDEGRKQSDQYAQPVGGPPVGYPKSERMRQQQEASQIRKEFRGSPNYTTVVADVAKGQKAYTDMVAKLNEIVKRGGFLPQDTFGLAKLYNQILEPGLQVTEQEVRQSISNPKQWQNSALGKMIQRVTGALWLDDKNVGALLNDAAGMMGSRQQTASDYIQREKEALRQLGYSEEAIQILDREVSPFDYETQSKKTISQLEKLSKNDKVQIEGVTPKDSSSATPSFTPMVPPVPSGGASPAPQTYRLGDKTYNVRRRF